MWYFLFGLVLAIPLGLMVFTACRLHGRCRERVVLVPAGVMSGGMPRPPGESVHEKLEAMDEELGDLLFGIAALLVTAVYLALAFHHSISDPIHKAVALLAVVAVPVPFHLRKLRALQGIEAARQRLRLGFRSERYTAQYLNEFMRMGAEVLHDVPVDRVGVIDHILVVPQGVFTFESKGCESPEDRSGEGGGEGATASYDGEAISFPGRRCTRALVQAKRHARHVQQRLQERFGHVLPVFPVVALPGWTVAYATPRETHKVQVLNPKDMAELLARCTSPPVFGQEHIELIARYLREAEPEEDPPASGKRRSVRVRKLRGAARGAPAAQGEPEPVQ